MPSELGKQKEPSEVGEDSRERLGGLSKDNTSCTNRMTFLTNFLFELIHY